MALQIGDYEIARTMCQLCLTLLSDYRNKTGRTSILMSGESGTSVKSHYLIFSLEREHIRELSNNLLKKIREEIKEAIPNFSSTIGECAKFYRMENYLKTSIVDNFDGIEGQFSCEYNIMYDNFIARFDVLVEQVEMIY